ncbi:F0F1 ATP synthase subunit delta [Oceanobacillus sp. FSL W8-0428]|uniref:ATP synthase subunit delta n=1 Tax=Oceanobacillus sojae TaxID=582851 RepID=A0A511ZQ29_9BACI|nr:F0F1 ATP synthase subunit delta [Oceanobacillus sojae]GEN89560.1 ATP synthase subunit delta [Oceanobacillus sojae]
MSSAVVAKRYADALFRLGVEQQKLEQFAADLKVVKPVFQNDKKLAKFLTHPKIDNAKKKQLVVEAFQGLDKTVLNTLQLLVDRHRTSIIPTIIDEYISLVNDAKGMADATVYSTRSLSDEEKSQLERSFAVRLGKSAVQLNNIVDPSILGGVKIRVGNTIYDGTVKGKLNRISRSIVSANN